MALAGPANAVAADSQPASIYAQASGEDEWALDNDFSVTDDSPDLTWSVDAAFENFFNTREDLDFEDAWKKQEVATHLDVKYGSSDRYLKTVTDLYFFPTFLNDDIGDDYSYSPESRTYRNLRISTEDSEVIFREFYYNWLFDNYRLRIGNQVYAWGTADGLNSTAYLNPVDLRELLLKDEDEFRLGVPSASGMIFFSDFTLQLVFVPIHTAAAIPSTGHFWSVKEVDGQYPVYWDRPEPMDIEAENFGYAARLSSTWKGVDFSVSGYHGPDNDMTLLPTRTVLIPGRSIGIEVEPRSYVVDYVGADFSAPCGDLVFNAEAAYSPNKHGIVEQNTDQPQTLDFPYDTRETDYLSYSVGFNYFIPLQKLIPGHAGDSLFTLEWYQAAYFDDAIEEPNITDLLSFQFQDSYFDKKVKVWLTTIFETRRGGVIVWPRLGYDFQNGFEAELGWVGINGKGEGDYDEDALFYYYRDNDLITFELSYAFP